MTGTGSNGSLIERDARVYDFGRPRAVPVVSQGPEPVIEDDDDDDAWTPPPATVFAPLAAFAAGTAEAPSSVPPIAAVSRAALASRGMIVPGAPVGALAEEFRLIKRQLLLTAAGVDADRARTVLVGSGKPGDGKTYCAINLALSLAAERDMAVLLVDADFAKPDVLARLGLEDGPGLLDALADETLDVETLVVPTDVPNLSLLPAGTRHRLDTELLASARTRAVLARLLAADPRRMVVFDSPPALAASPASVLALLVGQVMLVVRADRTTESDVRAAVARLDGCEHIQLVLNAMSFVPGGDRFGSYYGQEDRS